MVGWMMKDVLSKVWEEQDKSVNQAEKSGKYCIDEN